MKSGIRRIGFSLVLVGAAIYLLWFTGESRLRREYNAIVAECVDPGRFEEAIRRLEPLLGRGSAEVEAEVRRALAQSYAGWADAEGATREQRVERLQKAWATDPEVLNDTERREVEQAERAR